MERRARVRLVRPVREEAVTTVRKIYTCRRCEVAKESYRAIDDVPVYGHLCAFCFQDLREDVKPHYMQVVPMTGGIP